MTEKTLYWVDDETRSYALFSLHLPEGIKLKPYAGNGRVNDFIDDLTPLPSLNTGNNFFLLDVLMPVPKKLQRITGIWPPDLTEKELVCGLALARYLHDEHGVTTDQIRLLSTFGLTVEDNLEQFNTSSFELTETHVLDKGAFDATEFKRWLTT